MSAVMRITSIIGGAGAIGMMLFGEYEIGMPLMILSRIIWLEEEIDDIKEIVSGRKR